MTSAANIRQDAYARWRPLAERQNLTDADFEALADAYAESHRRYHTLVHILEMLACLDQTDGRPENPDALLLAVWFHDVVYDSRAPKGGNEQASADWLASVCAAPAAVPAARMILHSAHHGPSEDPDTRLFCDLDLYRLAGPYATFRRHGDDVRAEYAWVDDAAWIAGRGDFLHGMLARETIYQTAYWQARLEAEARDNLRRAIAELASG
jgi:predicted metal-dependent HD superfamily phosphohydrolase